MDEWVNSSQALIFRTAEIRNPGNHWLQISHHTALFWIHHKLRIGNPMNPSAIIIINDLYHKWYFSENSPKLARALRFLEVERILK